MIWKGLMVVTGSESPIVVVLRLKHVTYVYMCIYTVHDYSIMDMLRKATTQQRGKVTQLA